MDRGPARDTGARGVPVVGYEQRGVPHVARAMGPSRTTLRTHEFMVALIGAIAGLASVRCHAPPTATSVAAARGELPSNSLFARVSPLAWLPADSAAVVVVEHARLLSADGSRESPLELSWLSAPMANLATSGVSRWLSAADVAHSLAADQPAGLVWLELESETVIGFFQIADGPRLARALRALAEDRDSAWQRARASGRARILSWPAQGVGIVVRDDWLFVISSGAASAREAIEVRLASQSGGAASSGRLGGLLAEPGFRRVAAALEPGGAGLVYLSMDALAQPARTRLADVEHAMDELLAESEQDLQTAREQGVGPLQERALSDHSKRLRKRFASMRQQIAIERHFIEQLWAGLGPIAGTVATADAEARLQMVAAPVADTLAARLIAERLTPKSLPKSLPKSIPSAPAAHRAPAAERARPRWHLDTTAVEPKHLWTAASLAFQAMWNVPLERVRRALAEGAQGADDQRRQRPLGMPRTVAVEVAPIAERLTVTLPVERARARFMWLAEQMNRARATEAPNKQPAASDPEPLRLDTPAALFTVEVRGDTWAISAQSKPDRATTGRPGDTVERDGAGPPPIAPLPADDNPDVPYSDAYRGLVAEHGAIAERIETEQRALADALSAARRDSLRALGSLSARVARRGPLLRIDASIALGAADLHDLWRHVRTAAGARAQRREQSDATIARLRARAAAIGPELLRVRASDVQRFDLAPPPVPD